MSQGARDPQPVRARLERELLILMLALVLTFSISAIVDTDLGGHIAYGRDHMASGHLPLHDPYSYTANDTHWVNHEWVFELVVAWIFAKGGALGLVFLQASTWTAIGAVLLWLLRRSSKAFLPGAIVFLLFATTAFASITIRPHLFTYLFFALLLLFLELARSGRLRWLLGIPPLFLAWVNVHGGFLAGLCVLSAYAGGLALDAVLKRDAPGDLPLPAKEPARLALAALAATAGALALTLVNPYGFGLWAWLGRSLGQDRSGKISEWRTVAFDAQGILFLLLCALVVAAVVRRAVVAKGGRVPLAHAFVLAGTMLLAVKHVRHATFFAMAACAFAPGALADLYQRLVPPPDEDLEPQRLKRFRLLYGLILVPALLINFSLPNRDTLGLYLRPDGQSPFPTGAMRYIDEHPEVRGNLLVHFDWAQMMIYRYYPRLRVFYDGRFRTVYGEDLEAAYFDFHWEESPRWRRALDDYPTDYVLFEADRGVAERMRAQPDWHVVYQDTQSILFARGPATGEPTVGPHPPPIIPFEPREQPTLPGEPGTGAGATLVSTHDPPSRAVTGGTGCVMRNEPRGGGG